MDLCGDENCIRCFESSMASHPKACNVIDRIDLNTVPKNSQMILKFKCEQCQTIFESVICQLNLHEFLRKSR